jgi:hypothetical protein
MGEPALQPCKVPAEIRSDDCAGSFAHRAKGGNCYCAACRPRVHKIHQAARKSVSRALGNISKSLFLPASPGAIVVCDRLLTERSDRRTPDALLEKLHVHARLLREKGPQRQEVRERASNEAGAILLVLAKDRSGKRTTENAITVAHSMLRDAGILRGFDEASRRDLLSHASEAVKRYRRARAYADVVDALLHLANTFRIVESLGHPVDGDRAARSCALAALSELDERFGKRCADERIVRLRHQALLWLARFDGFEGANFLNRLDDDSLTPTCKVLTLRERVGVFVKDGSDLDEAHAGVKELNKQRARLARFPEFVEPTLVRPHIELLLREAELRHLPQRREEAIDMIREMYLPMYRHNRMGYYFGVLMKWGRDLGLNLNLARPTYASPVLPYLPTRPRG